MSEIYRGRRALVTGASSGIGEAFARELARRGMHLVLVARSAQRLDALAAELESEHGCQALPMALDLAQPGSVEQLEAELARRQLAVDMLINNAGFGQFGPYHRLDARRDHEQVSLNVAAVVDLSHALLPGMVERGHGQVINVASLAAFQPVPFNAVYAASKAFVLSLSEALWAEYRGTDIRVLAVCPGPVRTNFANAAGRPTLFDELPAGQELPVERIVSDALRALERRRSHVVPGVINKLLALPARLLPRQLLVAGAARAVPQ